MSITDPLRFFIVLVIGGLLIQLTGCEPGPLNDYLRPYPTQAYCEEMIEELLAQQKQKIQDICEYGYGNYNGGGIQYLPEYSKYNALPVEGLFDIW